MNAKRRRASAVLTDVIASITEEDRRRVRDRMLLAGKIADAMEGRKLTQKKFAELMGKSESEISEWLSGNRNFTVDTLSDIRACLGVRLLSDSEIRTKRVRVQSERKVTKTRSPYQYCISGSSASRYACGEWTSSDSVLSLV